MKAHLILLSSQTHGVEKVFATSIPQSGAAIQLIKKLTMTSDRIQGGRELSDEEIASLRLQDDEIAELEPDLDNGLRRVAPDA